jgi:hypothetical protein
MNEERWKVIRQFYMDTFGISPDLVDLLADKDILTMCVSGASNRSISTALDIEEEDVKKVIQAIFDFNGWEKDLSINPLILNDVLDKGILEMIATYNKISERIDKEWI